MKLFASCMFAALLGVAQASAPASAESVSATAASSLKAAAQPMLVEKKSFTTTEFRTVSGKVLPSVTVGWESYGSLNAAKDNVILITHFFSGNSHAAGKYAESDPQSGYWDAIIGPGKAIDTNRFFVVSADTLVNANVHDGHTITTGPASINPETGKPWGLDFPVVTIHDFVEVQRLLLESLGIEKLHAVMGASMGSFQALDWAVSYPDRVERLIHVIGADSMDAWSVPALEKWALPIRLDPNWRGGDYYGKTPPVAGLTAALLNITQDAMAPEAYLASFKDFTVADKGALADIRTLPQISQILQQRAGARAALQDANHVLYLVRASQLFSADWQGGELKPALAKIKAKSLLLPASGDLLLRPQRVRQMAATMKELGKEVEISEIKGPWGHLDGLFSIQSKSDEIRAFLAD